MRDECAQAPSTMIRGAALSSQSEFHVRGAESMTVGFGIVGCGMIAGFHARAIQDLPSTKVVAVYTTNPENGKKIADLNGNSDIYTDYAQFLKHPGLRIVNVCT